MPSLCQHCTLVRRIQTGKGSVFLMCTKSVDDSRFPKYPRQPVVRCSGYESEKPGETTSN